MSEQTADLRILSPSVEAEGGLNFHDLPVSTTVGELKAKIKDVLPTHPAVERMRIIYLGRMMMDSIPLADVFGRDTLQQQRVHNLHMVLREDGPSPAPRSSTAPPNPFRPAPPPPPTNPFRPRAAAAVPPRPQSQPPHAHHTHPNPIPNIPAARFTLGQGLQLPPLFNNILDQQLAAQARGHHHHHHHHHHPPGQPHTPPQMQAPGVQNHNAFQEYMAQQQQQRAAVGTQNTAEGNNANQASGGQQQYNQANTPRTHSPRNPFVPNSTTSFTQEGFGPNGERWSVTVNNSTLTFPQQPGFGLPGLPNPIIPIPGQFANIVRPASPSIVRDGSRVMHPIRLHLEAVRRQVVIINELLAPPGSSREERLQLPPSTFQRAASEIEVLNNYLDMLRNLVNTLVSNPQYARNRELVSLQMDNETMRNATRILIRNIQRHIAARRDQLQSTSPNTSSGQDTNTSNAPATPVNRAEPSSPSQQAESAAASTSTATPAQTQGGSAPSTEQLSTPARPSGTNNVFLVWSPEGPRAVLYSPQATLGSLTVPSISEAWAQNLAYQRALSDVARLVAPTRAAFANRQSPTPTTPLPNAPRAEPGDIIAQAQQAFFERERQADAQQAQAPLLNPVVAAPRPQQQAQAPQQGQVAIAAVLAGHIWVLIRIFGFIYLFGGAGWRRTIMLALCGLAVYIVQMGFLGDRFPGDRWERVRRYFDNLVGIPQAGQVAAGQAANEGQAPDGNDNNQAQDDIGADGQPRRRRELSPETVARRLLAQRQQQDRTWLRETLRGVERSVALFVASLWPGFGERMVAAREEAEAQARRDQQDREERERREAEERESAATAEQAQEQEKPQTQEPESEDQQASVEIPHQAAEEQKLDKGKGKERATDDHSGEGSSSSALPSASEVADAGAEPRAREGWSFDELD